MYEAPDTVLTALQVLTHLVFTTLIGTIVTLLLQMKKPRHRELKKLDSQVADLQFKPRLSTSKSTLSHYIMKLKSHKACTYLSVRSQTIINVLKYSIMLYIHMCVCV